MDTHFREITVAGGALTAWITAASITALLMAGWVAGIMTALAVLQ